MPQLLSLWSFCRRRDRVFEEVLVEGCVCCWVCALDAFIVVDLVCFDGGVCRGFGGGLYVPFGAFIVVDLVCFDGGVLGVLVVVIVSK